jgi:hypothetical protein
MRALRIALISVLLMGFGLPLIAGIPFLWLDGPTARDNRHDPKSPLFVPTNTPGQLVVGPPATDTSTPTPLGTSTFTATPSTSPTLTPTQTPSYDAYDPGDDVYTGATNAGAFPFSQSGHFVGYGADVYDFFVVPFVDTHTYQFTVTINSGGSSVTFDNMGTSGGSVVGTYTGNPATANLTSSGINGNVYFRVHAPAGVGYTFAVNDITGASPTFTQTPLAATATPSPTPTQTAVQPAWPVVYNGDTVPLGGNFYGHGGSSGAVEVTSAGNGAGGSNVYVNVTVQSAIGGYSAAGAFAFGYTSGGAPITQDVTGYTSLSISVRVPSGAGNCLVPGVSLATFGSGVSKTTKVVSLENYLIGGPAFIGPDAWYTALVPVSLFAGFNGSPTPNDATITAADLMATDSVVIQPINFGNQGDFLGAVYVDDVVFNSAASTANSTGRTGLFADFENGTADNWGGFWSANVDPFTAADCPGYVAPPSATNLSQITYGGITDTAGAAGSSTPCHDGHLAGWTGAFNGPYASPACSNVNAFPYLNMSANLTNDGLPHSLADNVFIPSFPGGGATGLKLKLKLGTSYAGQVYKIFLEKTSANQGNQFAVQVRDSELSTSSWTSFTFPFPPDGTQTGVAAYPTHPDQGGADTVANDHSWMQTQYSNDSGVWNRSDIYQFGIGPIIRGKEADILIDDIQFY